MDAAVRAIGSYRIMGRRSAGGGGLVYRALDDAGHPAAVKVARSSAPREIEALIREIRIIQRLNRAQVPGVIQLLATGHDGDRPWYAMEWVDGSDLRSLAHELWANAGASARAMTVAASGLISETIDLDGRPNPETTVVGVDTVDPIERRSDRLGGSAPLHAQRLRKALAILVRVAIVLRDVHAQGLVHGDVSPGNILLRDSGEPVLLDFGTSFAAYEAEVSREFPYAWERAKGTPGYAAPEVLSGGLLDWRCDIYGLGCIAYELLVGRRPFVATSVDDLIAQHLSSRVPQPKAICPDLPDNLQALLLRLLEKDPSRRTAHVEFIVHAFRSALGDVVPTARDGAVPAALFRPPLCGREPELATLDAAIRDAKGGRGSLVVVTGPSGIGKTRLLNEGGMLAARRGMVVVTCRGSRGALETDASVPLAGVMDLVEPVLQCAHDLSARGFDLDRATPEESSLARSYSVLQTYAGAVAPDTRTLDVLPKLAPDASVQRVFEALSSLLSRIARREGLLLLVDDVQWADTLSSRFLEFVGPQLQRWPILVLCAHRSDVQEGSTHVLSRLAQSVLALRGLEAAPLIEMTKGLAGIDMLPEGLDEYVVRNAEGNPLFAAEYVRLAQQQGWLKLAERVDWHYPGSTGAAGAPRLVPCSVDDLVSSRLERLPAKARELAQLAAVIGREFDEATLTYLSERGDFAEPLEQLIRAHIIEELPNGGFRFTYDKLREAAARATPDHAQKHVHLALARGLETSVLRSRAETRSARLGYHWSRAGDHARAVIHLRAAAAEAARKNALDLACELYRAALAECASGAYDGAELEALFLYENLGDILVTRARHSEARDCYDNALRGNRDRLTRVRLNRKRASSFWTTHEYDAAAGELDLAEKELRALDSADPAAHARELIEIQLGRFEHLYFSQKQGPEIEGLLEDLAPLIEAWADDSQRNTYYLAAASQRQLAARYAFDQRAVEFARMALQASHSLTQERQAVARFLFAFSLVFGTNAHRAEALPHLERSAREASETQSVTLLSRIRAHYAIASLRLGRLSQTGTAAELALRAAEDARLPPYVAASTACLGWVKWRSGELEQARRLLDRARRIWLSHPHPFPLRWLAGFPLLAFADADDDFEIASELLKDLVHPSQQALPTALDASVQAALEACSVGLGREASEAIRAVLRVAREESFC